MKNTIIIFALLLSFLNHSYGQVSFGVKGGLNLTNLVMDDEMVDDINMKLGLTGGIFLTTEIFDWFAVKPEILFTTKGAKYDVGNFSVDARVNYIDIPIAGVVRLFGAPLSIHAGPQFSFFTNGKYDYKGGIFGNETVTDTNKDSFKKFDLGGFVGLGFQYQDIQIEARLTRGINKVENDRMVLSELFRANDARNFGIQLTVGIRLF